MTARTSFRLSPRGHQNSSAGTGKTQSAPCSATARRPNSVTSTSREACVATSRIRPEHVAMTSSARIRRGDDEVDACVQVEGEVRVQRARRRHQSVRSSTNVIGCRAYRATRPCPSEIAPAARSSRRRTAADARHPRLGLRLRRTDRSRRPRAATLGRMPRRPRGRRAGDGRPSSAPSAIPRSRAESSMTSAAEASARYGPRSRR